MPRFIIAALCALSACLPQAAADQTRPIYPEHYKRSVKIEVDVPNRGGIMASGSHIGNGQILTNRHVCDYFQPGFQGTVTDYKKRVWRIRDYVNSPTPRVDLCVLQTNATDLPVVEFEKDASLMAKSGDWLFYVGFPAGNFNQAGGYMIGYDLVQVGDPEGESVVMYLGVVKLVTAGGASGSPVYNREGRMIGVLNAGGGGEMAFVPQTIVEEFLRYANKKFRDQYARQNSRL